MRRSAVPRNARALHRRTRRALSGNEKGGADIFLPRDLADAAGPWVNLLRQDGELTAKRHAAGFGGRTWFLVRAWFPEGRAAIEGEWAGRVTGLGDQHVEIAMMRTPDGHSRLELSRFLRPAVVADHRKAPVNALGYLRVMFAVDDLDGTLARLGNHGAQLVGEVVNYQNVYLLCYIRGPEGLLIGLAQELG